MLSIQFESREDFLAIYEEIQTFLHKTKNLGENVLMKVEDDKNIILDFQENLPFFYNDFHPFLAAALTKHIIETCEEKWLFHILKNIFYYEDEEEMKQIIAIARSILEGDRDDLPSLKPLFARYEHIYQAIAEGIDHETTFYYEPFLTFRLKAYGEMLIDCVEMAIDEYLLEQEYQNLVAHFRHYIHTEKNRTEKIQLVHQKNTFIFLDEHFRLITDEMKRAYLVPYLVFEEQLEINEMVITPLVCFNPKEVVIYTEEEENGVIYTIQTIFEERVRIYPFRQFADHFFQYAAVKAFEK